MFHKRSYKIASIHFSLHSQHSIAFQYHISQQLAGAAQQHAQAPYLQLPSASSEAVEVPAGIVPQWSSPNTRQCSWIWIWWLRHRTQNLHQRPVGPRWNRPWVVSGSIDRHKITCNNSRNLPLSRMHDIPSQASCVSESNPTSPNNAMYLILRWISAVPANSS